MIYVYIYVCLTVIIKEKGVNLRVDLGEHGGLARGDIAGAGGRERKGGSRAIIF